MKVIYICATLYFLIMKQVQLKSNQNERSNFKFDNKKYIKSRFVFYFKPRHVFIYHQNILPKKETGSILVKLYKFMKNKY
jgi:acyl-CoA synthetase (AMP-forming)/AMP-acid ligase II